MQDPKQDALAKPLVTLQEAIQWLARDDPDYPKPTVRSSGIPTAEELRMLRDESRWFARRQPFYISALVNRINYLVGSGHRYTIRARKGQEIDDQTLERATGEIEEFTERVGWQFRQEEIQRRLDRDGEAFLRFFRLADGRLDIRFIEPERIRTPPGHLANPPVRSGVEHAPGDEETAVAYWYQSDPSRPDRFERIEAAEIQHRRAGVDSTWPRGLPLSEGIADNLRRSWKLLRNITTVAGIQAAIAIVRKHNRATGGTVQEYAARAAQQNNPGTGTATEDYQRFVPGAIVDTPSGVEYDFPAGGIDVAKFTAGVQAELRAMASALVMPEFMLTADASNANYSSTMVAEGPSVKNFERLQSSIIWADCEVLRRVLQEAESAGRLPEGLHRMVVIDGEAPLTQARDRLAEAQADEIHVRNGAMSPQTMAGRDGRDWGQERELMDAAEEATGIGLGIGGSLGTQGTEGTEGTADT